MQKQQEGGCIPSPEHGHAEEAKDGVLDPRERHVVVVASVEDDGALEGRGLVLDAGERLILGVRRRHAPQGSPRAVHAPRLWLSSSSGPEAPCSEVGRLKRSRVAHVEPVRGRMEADGVSQAVLGRIGRCCAMCEGAYGVVGYAHKCAARDGRW